jgi:MYXO-CTERM domain-containing protein
MVAIDPSNNSAYLTEDRIDSCFYRFVPDSMSEPFVGRLQAMKVVGQDGFNTLLMAEGEVIDIEWVDLTTPDPDDDGVRDEAQELGAALIIRGEGIWFFEGQVYICATAGGPLGKGQIFRLIDGDNPTLEVIAVSTDASVLNNPDNITVAPWGELFLVENGDVDNYIRWINAAGEVCDFGRNVLSSSEMTGVCFSPDGAAMFVNIQENGITLVITGPFPGTSPGDGDGDTEGDGDGDPGDGDGDTGGNTDTEGNESTDAGAGTDTTADAGLDNGSSGTGCSCSTNEAEPLQGAALAAFGLAFIAVCTGGRDRTDSCV